ncbi:TetR/AcrR family transcriptional regulator [Mesorhizobium hawassense]|uniref:TetR/AcrR family transcriptional regulator n=2 Tax=Mesorhizobium hawassense TaxID=1209954 RepID=A0A330HUM5_9HYPH|nr:TetR/AcrR family transcriptional regulator [Mesorhizobium hawassense]
MGAGRPREFDIDQALDRAVLLFWRHGYEGTSIADLTDALGITRASLYAAFGSKEVLFQRVMDRYESRAGAYRRAAQQATALEDAIRLLMTGPVELHGDKRNPQGCLGVQGALSVSASSQVVRGDLATRRRRGELGILDRLRRAQDEGELQASAQPGDLARYLSALIYGMAVLSADGASKKELAAVADIALRGWSKIQ